MPDPIRTHAFRVTFRTRGLFLKYFLKGEAAASILQLCSAIRTAVITFEPWDHLALYVHYQSGFVYSRYYYNVHTSWCIVT